MPGAGELRVLRRRIRSVKSTQKITKAMELIAASRINRARRAVESARPYAEMITEVIRSLAAAGDVGQHPLIAPHDEVRTVGIIIVTSDRGLAGAYNSNILRRAERLAKEERDAGREVRIYSLGRKAETYFRYRQQPIAEAWTGIADQPRYSSACEVGDKVMQAYTNGDLDRVWLVYTNFKSAMTQMTAVAKVLPVEAESFEGGKEYPPQFIFEPDPDDILELLIPRYVQHRIFAGMLEGAASEHASRQRAMKAATDNAGDIIEDLTREANRARQAAITTEISEIVGGAEALSAP
ncbi:MAG TPA: F0F1 ATP synthase subunit gamma [Egibacteraceae bacterium]|nr:F0F1 ATP synthase subunit gamma [Egibacteraceae bacterium]